MRAVAVFVILALAGPASASPPWAERCRTRFAKAKLGALGRVKLEVVPAKPKGRGDRFGEVRLVVESSKRKLTARVTDDHSGHRHRNPRGLASRIYETWHSPYADSRDGVPPATPIQEERHHSLAVGMLLGELVIEGADATTIKTFADTMKPIIEACTADVTADEADPSLAWTTACLKELAAAQATLVKRDPVFAAATCRRETFHVSCGKIDDNQPRWNALTSLAGPDNAKLQWEPDGPDRIRYAGGDGEIWAQGLSAAKVTVLFDAFRTPLVRCSKLMRAAR